jgi:hypothetical protein
VKRMLVAVVSALSLVLAAATGAPAEPVQQFSFQVTKIKPDGRFTLIFDARTFDTTGGVPPDLLTNYVRLPAGAKLRPEFLTKRYFCDGPALRNVIDRHRERSDVPFPDRVANLGWLERLLSRSKSARDKRALANVRTCERARIGGGTADIDARGPIPALTDLVPSRFSLFFSAPTEKGAIAGFTVVGSAVAEADIVRKYPIVGAVHVALTANFFNDPTADGIYGYRLRLPRPDIAGLQHISIARLHVVNPGLWILKGTCLKRGRDGRCTKQQKKTISWFTQPKCPPSGKISFLSFYEYADPVADITKMFELACPDFSR